ncbi:hypothetical protein NL676_008445 [Syzygium grande]|nr:hypothetical protein NL676_008445 [Syzygium grande]
MPLLSHHSLIAVAAHHHGFRPVAATMPLVPSITNYFAPSLPRFPLMASRFSMEAEDSLAQLLSLLNVTLGLPSRILSTVSKTSTDSWWKSQNHREPPLADSLSLSGDNQLSVFAVAECSNKGEEGPCTLEETGRQRSQQLRSGGIPRWHCCKRWRNGRRRWWRGNLSERREKVTFKESTIYDQRHEFRSINEGFRGKTQKNERNSP